MELVQIKKEETNILERLLQLYLHDISFHFPMNFDESTGLYLCYSLDKYFDDSINYAYFIKHEEKLAGFMFVDTDDNNIYIQEMFVLNSYKNKSIGKLAAFEVFNKHKGNWMIKSLPCSEPSERFWNKTIKEYTSDNFNLERTGNYNRAVFTFNNK